MEMGAFAMTLIDRLSKLEGPDREVDAEIDVIFFGGETVWKQSNYTMEQFPASKRASKSYIGGYAYEYVPSYTDSVDAAISLAARALPGYRWSAGFSRHVPHNAQIWVPSESGYYEGESDANRAIALCIAILRAKEASHGE